MRKSILKLILIVFLLQSNLVIAVQPTARTHRQTASAGDASEKTNEGKTSQLKLDRKAIEQQLGQKLKLGERIVLWVAKKKLKKKKRLKAKKEDHRTTYPLAVTAFALSFLVALIPIILGVIAIIKINKDPEI